MKKVKLVDLAEVRRLTHQDRSTTLADMNNRELPTAVPENFRGPEATETVVRTRATDAPGGAGEACR